MAFSSLAAQQSPTPPQPAMSGDMDVDIKQPTAKSGADTGAENVAESGRNNTGEDSDGAHSMGCVSGDDSD